MGQITTRARLYDKIEKDLTFKGHDVVVLKMIKLLRIPQKQQIFIVYVHTTRTL